MFLDIVKINCSYVRVSFCHLLQGVKSPVLRTMLEESKLKNGFRCIKISGVPPEATQMFIRFLYSSRYAIA